MQDEKKICLAFTTANYNTDKCTEEFDAILSACNPCFTSMEASTNKIMTAEEITEDMTEEYQSAVEMCQTANEITFIGKVLTNCDEAYNELNVVKELNNHDFDGTTPLSQEGEALKEYIFQFNAPTDVTEDQS